MNGQPDNDFLKQFAIIAIVIYFFLGQSLASGGLGWGSNFRMNTFTKSAEGTRYVLRFVEIDGRQLEEPIYFTDAADLLTSPDIVEGKGIINLLGNALHNDLSAEANKHRQTLESVYFGDFETAKYEVIFLTVNPVEKYNLESFTLELILSEFNYSMASSQAAVDQHWN